MVNTSSSALLEYLYTLVHEIFLPLLCQPGCGTRINRCCLLFMMAQFMNQFPADNPENCASSLDCSGDRPADL
jgi:hypothetical protein